MKAKKYISSAAVIMMLSAMSVGCEKELDMEYHDIEPLPVVEASLTQREVTVAVSFTTPMNEAITDSRFTDAEVILTDLSSGDNYNLIADNEGLFRKDIAGIVGHEYRLNVKINENNYSSVSTMLASTEISDLRFYWIKMPGDDMAALRILFSDNPLTSDYYWIRIYRNGQAYTWSVITDRAAIDGKLEETITTTHRDESQEDEKQIIRDGDEVRAIVTPISRSMFDYLTAIMNSSNGENQFEGGRCLGYFLASPAAMSSVIYHPEDIGYAQ